MVERGLGDAGLLRRQLRSRLNRRLESQRLNGHRAAVHAAQQTLALERDEILADRLPGYAKGFGDFHGVDAAATQKSVEDVVLALVGVRGAGFDVVGHDTATGEADASAAAALAASSAAPRAPASLTSACTSSPKRRRLTAMSPALRDHPPVTTNVRCAPLTALIASWISAACSVTASRAARHSWAGPSASATPRMSSLPNAGADDAYLGHGQGDGVSVQGGQVGSVLAEQREDALQRKAALRCAEQAPVVGDGVPAGGDARLGEVGDDVGGQAGRDGPDQRFGGTAGIQLVTRSVGACADHRGLVVVAGDGQHRAGQPRQPGLSTDPAQRRPRRDQRRHQRLTGP